MIFVFILLHLDFSFFCSAFPIIVCQRSRKCHYMSTIQFVGLFTWLFNILDFDQIAVGWVWISFVWAHNSQCSSGRMRLILLLCALSIPYMGKIEHHNMCFLIDSCVSFRNNTRAVFHSEICNMLFNSQNRESQTLINYEYINIQQTPESIDNNHESWVLSSR